MKIISALLISCFALPSIAAPLKECQGITKTHIISLEQVGPDIHATLEDEHLHKYQPISDPKEGKLEIAGKEKSIMVISNKDISSFLKMRRLSRELMVALMLGRPEFQGEEDMIWAHADDLIHALVCK